MQNAETNDQSLHEYALELAREHRRTEGLLIQALEEIDACRLYRGLGYSSLFSYAVAALGLSEATAYAMISVARKARELAPLKAAIASQELTVSKAAKIIAILNQVNAAEMIAFAKAHTAREIEVEVARQAAVSGGGGGEPGKMYRLALPAALYEKIRRVQSVLATKRGKRVDRLEALEAAVADFLERHDPVKRADRAMERERKKQARLVTQAKEAECQESANSSATATNSSREELRFGKGVAHAGTGCAAVDATVDATGSATGGGNGSATGSATVDATITATGPTGRAQRVSSRRKRKSAAENHAVNARDRGRCTFVDHSGKRCESDCWIHHHHKVPVSLGGTNDPENLMSLCSFHHDLVHQLSFGIDGQVNWLREPRRAYS